MYKKVRQSLISWKMKRQFDKRAKAIRRAVKHAKGHDGLVISKAVYLQTLEILGIFASQVEKSGGIAPAVRKAMLADTMVITQGFVDALVLGDPSLQMDEVRNRYVNARQRSQSRKARARQAIQQAVRMLGDKAPKLPQKNLSRAQAIAVQGVQAAVAEARKSVTERKVG